MTNITTVTLAAGIPTVGTGTVSTIDALLGAGALLEVVPVVTAGAYHTGDVIGYVGSSTVGYMTFTNILAENYGGILESITLKFKGTVQTVEFDVAIFTAAPTGTFTNNAAPAIAAADSANLLGIFPMVYNLSTLGTHTIYTLDGISKQIIGASRNLYAAVTCKAAPVNPASTSDMSLALGVAW